MEETNKDKVVVRRISVNLAAILDNIKSYMKEISYNSLNPSDYEASEFLVARLKKKDLSKII